MTEKPMRKGTDPVVLLVFTGLALLVLALVILPSVLNDKPTEQDQREIRICEMTKAMGGASVTEAELLCARGWER